MNGQAREPQFDQALSDWLESDAHVAPSAPVEAAITFARQNPRRRDWLGFLRRDAMTAQTGSSMRPALLLVALVALLALAVGGVALFGSPDASPTPEASASPSSALGGFFHPTMDGNPIPEVLLGEWRDAGNRSFWTFYAAGSEFCTEEVHTRQDCITFRGTDMLVTDIWDAGILTEIDGVLFLDITQSTNSSHSCHRGGEVQIIEELTWEIRDGALWIDSAENCIPDYPEDFPLTR